VEKDIEMKGMKNSKSENSKKFKTKMVVLKINR